MLVLLVIIADKMRRAKLYTEKSCAARFGNNDSNEIVSRRQSFIVKNAGMFIGTYVILRYGPGFMKIWLAASFAYKAFCPEAIIFI